MDKKASSIPVTVALTSDMVSSSVLAVEHSEDTQVKNDNELPSVIDSPNEEISSLPASVTPQPTKVDSIPAPDQVKFVALERLDFSSRPSDVKADVVAIDDVAPDVLEATMSDNAPVAAGGVPLVEDATVIERSQAAKDEATLGEESLGKEEYSEVTAPMAQKEPELKDIPVLDSAQSPQEPPTTVATSIVEKDVVIEDAIVNEKAPLIEEEERVAAAEGAVVEATPATITSENFEAPSASFLEAPKPEGTVEKPVSADVADESIVAEGTVTKSVKAGEEEEVLELATTIATKTIPLEVEAPTVSVVDAATIKEREIATFEAKGDDLEKTSVMEANPIVEVKQLEQGGALPSVERHESPSPLAEEASIVEAVTSKEVGPTEAVIGGSSASAVTVPPVEEPTSSKDTSTESAEQVTVGQSSTATVLTAPVVSEEILLGESITVVESPAVEEKVVVSSTPNVKDAPITAESLDPAALTSVTEDPLAVPSVDDTSVAEVSTGEVENDSSTPVTELTMAAEVDLTVATNEPAEILEPLEEVPVVHAPFVRQLSAAEAPIGAKSMVAEETSASEATGEPGVTVIHETDIETTSFVVDETPANHTPVALSVPTKELEAAEAEIPVEKELPVDDSLIVEEITTTEELSAVEQGVQVFNISENPPAIEEVLEEASAIRPSPTAEDDTVGDKASSIEPGEHVLEPHTSTSSGVTEKAVAMVTSPIEYVSLDAADDLPAEQEGKLGGDPVVVDQVEKVSVVNEETVLKVGQSPVEAPLCVDTEKALTKDASIEGTSETTAEANPVMVVPQGEFIDIISHEERISADGPSIAVEKVKDDEVHAAPSSGTGTAVDDEPGIERKGAEEEANTQIDDYVPSSQETSSTEGIVASLVEEKRETLAQVDQSEIEDNKIADESLVVDTSIEINDSTPITVIEAPVVVGEVDLREPKLASTSTASPNEVAANPVSNQPLSEKESNIDAAETASTQQVDAGSHSATLLTPARAEIEHPKSPWTPSYSVITQGPGISAEEDIPAIEDLPPSLSQVPAVALTPVDSSAPLDEVQTQTPSEILENHPKSPWTPSYSVSVQGSPLHGTAALNETEQVNSIVVADISVAEEPASSQSNIPDEVEATTEPAKDESQEESIRLARLISASAPESVTEKTKTTDDGKLPMEEEHDSTKELTTDTSIDRPASLQATSYSITEGIVSTASEAEGTFATSLVPENVVYEGSSQVEERYASQASIHEVAEKPEVTIISPPVVVAGDAATPESTPPGAIGVEVRDLHAVERPVEPVASPSIELQFEKTDGIASTPELDDNLEKPADVKVDVEPHAGQTIVSPEESQLPVVQEPVMSLAHEDAVINRTQEVGEPSVPSTTVPEVQSVKFDVGEVVVPRTYIAAEAEVPTETLPTVDESPKDSIVETVNAEPYSDSVTQEVIPTPEPVSEVEVKLRVQVSSSEELLAPAAEIERPASPWTPSYSVAQQGDVTPTSEVGTILPTSGAAIDAVAPKEYIVQAEPTPEYLSPNVELSIEPPQVLAVVPDVSGEREAKEDPEDVHPSTAADVEILHESDTTLLSANTEIDRPSSPWTASYSVTQQGCASPVPESDLDVESAENEVPAKDGLDEDITFLGPEPHRQVESAEPVVVTHTPINDEPISVGGEIASSVLEHGHESLRQADASLTIPVVEEVLVVAAVPLAGPESHAPEVEPVVKEKPAEVPTVPEPGNDLEPAVKDDTVNVGKHQERDMGPAEGYKEHAVLTAPELEFDAESSVKDETVVSEPLTRGGEGVVSHAQVLVDEINEDEDDEEAHSPILASVEKEKRAETEHIPSPEVESVVNNEFVREEEVTLPSPGSEHDSRLALKDVPVEDQTELDVEKAASPIVATEAGQDAESAVKEEAFEDERDNHIVSPAPVSVTQEEFDEQVVPPAEESSAKGETATVHDSEQHIETVEEKQVQDGPVVQDELIKEGQDNEIILASTEPAVEDKQSGEQGAVPSPELEHKIESAVVGERVADDHIEPVAAPEPEPHLEPVVEAKVELVATSAPDPYHEIEAVEKKVEEPAEIVLDEQATLPVLEPESAVVDDEPVASPAPVEIKSESAIVDDSALLQGSNIESKARDEQIEVPLTKEVPGLQEDATLPPPKAEPESVAKAEEGQIKDVQEIEPAAEEIEAEYEVVEGNDEQEASAVQQPSAKGEPAHAEQVAVPVLEAEQRTEVVIDAKESEDGPVSPEPAAEAEADKDGHDVKAIPQGELPSGRDEEVAPPAPELDSSAKEESLEDEQVISPAAQPTPVSKEESALAEPVPEKEVNEPVPEPAAVKDEVVILPAPELATEIKSLEEVTSPTPELDSPVKEKSFEDEQATSPAAQPAPALKEQVDVEPVPVLQQEIKVLEKEVDEPAEDVPEQPVATEPAILVDKPVLPPAAESATESVVEVAPDVEPTGIESAVKDGDRPTVSPVAKSLEPTVEPDAEEQTVVPVPIIIPAPELVTEVEAVVADEPSAELYVEPKAEDVQVEIKSAVKEDQIQDELEEPIAPEREEVLSEQAASPELIIKDEPQQEEKVEVELAKEEPVVKEVQVEAAASEEQPSLGQVHVEPVEEASREAEPAVKGEDVAADSVEDNTIDSRELSVDTSSFTDSTKSPWTPSHSMTTQDVGSPDAEMKKDLPGQAFPVTEEDRKSVGSLDTVNESADVVPETLEVPFTRKRLESSASARLLRGALHKVPEGRASLDMAQGEFTKLPSPVADTSTKGMAETLITTTEQEAGSTSSDESDGSSDDSSEAEHKGRWCVVM
ncbi:hypothetical protein F5146DRAFT_1032078 [Armillaria mellea]|nr:hypothetical protein F5146DRAFT_1032078 [Armillaria mellea]